MSVPTDGESNPRMDPHTGQIIFSDVNHTNRGSYLCRSIVNIPQAQIINHFDETIITVDMNGMVIVFKS
jgi:hypothetical protein